MRKLFLLSLSLIAAMGLQAAEGVILQLRNGQSVKFKFDETPVMVTGSEALQIKTSKETVVYDYADIVRSYFGDIDNPDSVDATTAESRNCLFYLSANGLEVSGLQEGETVSVYYVNGVIAATAKSANGQASITLPKASRKTYIATTSRGITFKFNR